MSTNGETVQVTIDGKEVTVPKGFNVIEAARYAGKEVPHYCYHPRLSVVGNCRICLVEIEGWPKLQIGCNTSVRDGMTVFTENERVKGAREGVMELLLINHPLDCPICDQAGECKLQDYAVDHGSGLTRFEFEKQKKPKNVPWGEKIVFDAERCILCTRCVRFLDELCGTDEIGMDFRGEKVTLIVEGDGELTSPYQMNIIDLCPVGALTSRDFRFKSRVWFMQFTNTICTSCARGCNVVAGVRDDRMLRMVPRFNPNVNDYWMCDAGRLHYAFVNDEQRLASPRVDGRPAPYPVALSRAASLLEKARGGSGDDDAAGEKDAGAGAGAGDGDGDGAGDAESIAVLGVASPFMTNEELHSFSGLLDALGADERWFLLPKGEGDDMLVHPEKAPNARGARLFGFEEAPSSAGDRKVDVLVWFRPREGAELPADLKAKTRVVFSLRPEEGADVNFPLTTWIEKDGTVISAGDRLQRLTKGLTYEPTLLTERLVLDRLRAKFEEGYKGADTASLALARIAKEHPAFEGVTWTRVGLQGVPLELEGAPA